MNKTKSELEKELNDLETQFIEDKKRLQKMINEFKSPHTKEEMDIATYLHEKLCTYNHTDGCDWYYDDGSWNRHSRTAYIKKAINFLQKGYTLQEIKDFYDTLNS